MNGFVCKADELASGQVKIVSVNAVEIGVFRHGDEYYAYQNVCPHQGGPACEGLRAAQVRDVINEKGLFMGQQFDEDAMNIVCPWHGYEFRIADGKHVRDDNVRLKRFDVSVRDGGVYVSAP
jgi:nitrite reductase/ring-hydroxylating ferredoxin subunit